MSSSAPDKTLFVFVTWELSPYFKVTGMGDLLQNVVKEMARRGLEVALIQPDFGAGSPGLEAPGGAPFLKPSGGETAAFRVNQARDEQGVDHYLIKNRRLQTYLNNIPDRPAEATLADLCFQFCYQAYLTLDALIRHSEPSPQRVVVHAFHWQSGPLLALLDKAEWRSRVRSILTVDILDQQGRFDPGSIKAHEVFHSLTDQAEGEVNLLRMGLETADLLHTVSPNYAREIQDPPNGRGLERLLQSRSKEGRLIGILNGLDPEFTDWRCIPVLNDNGLCLDPGNGRTADLKAKAKRIFQEAAGLPRDGKAFLISMGHRFVRQKNFALVTDALDGLMSLEPRPQIYLRAWPEPESGDPEWELWQRIARLSKRYRHNLAFLSPFDRDPDLAPEGIFIDRYLYYAASDLFLMPSLWEPCGLCQLEAMRFGAIPVVSEVGGLVDTVLDPKGKNGPRGFGLPDPDDPDRLTETVARAQELWGDQPKVWQGMVQRAMEYDSSIKKTVDSYLARLYFS